MSYVKVRQLNKDTFKQAVPKMRQKWPNGHMEKKNCSKSVITSKMQTRATTSCHLAPCGMATVETRAKTETESVARRVWREGKPGTLWVGQ